MTERGGVQGRWSRLDNLRVMARRFSRAPCHRHFMISAEFWPGAFDVWASTIDFPRASLLYDEDQKLHVVVQRRGGGGDDFVGFDIDNRQRERVAFALGF